MAEEAKKPEEEKKKEEKPAPKDNLVETKHSISIGGKELKYTVTTGTIILKQETPDREKEFEGEKPRASFFFTAYTLDGVDDPAKRPLTFFSTAVPARPRSGSTWAFWVRGG